MVGTGRRAIVIGGGVIGSTSAYFLSQDGWDVTIVDSGRFAGGCSHGNCGIVSPSHVLPLTEPGALLRAAKAMIQPNGPFRIRPRVDLALWKWLWHFARRCNYRDMVEAGHARHALLTSSRRLYDQLIADERMDCEWQAYGLLYVFQSGRAWENYKETDRILRDNFDLGAQPYTGQELTELEPALREGLGGGWLYPSDGHLRPDRLMACWRKVLEQRGVRIVEHCAVQDFANGSGRCSAVKTATEDLAGDLFVVATGALTPQWQRHLGCRIPIQPGKGYSMTMPHPSICPRFPLLFSEHKVMVTPMRSGYRLGSTMEFAGYDTQLDPRRLALLTAGATPYLKQPCAAPIQEEWYGWRPMTYDGVPIIDRSPSMENVWIAAGHNMLGLSMSPATGKLIAELIGGREPHVDPHPYRVSRFG